MIKYTCEWCEKDMYDHERSQLIISGCLYKAMYVGQGKRCVGPTPIEYDLCPKCTYGALRAPENVHEYPLFEKNDRMADWESAWITKFTEKDNDSSKD